MSIKTRLEKLELSLLTEAEPLRIGNFIVGTSAIEPVGYSCSGVQIIRLPDESIEDLQKRCFGAVVWPDCNHRKIFKPCYG